VRLGEAGCQPFDDALRIGEVSRIEIMTPTMLDKMRASCRLAAQTLAMVGPHIEPGITTEQIDVLVHDFITRHEAYPSPLNYHGFPKSVCTSVNEVVCHGIPSERHVLADGDIINVDVTTYLPAKHGFHGDTSATFYVGEPRDDAKHITETCRQALELGIREVRDGARIEDIGAAIQEFAEARDCSVVRDFVGHGIGREFHMPPQIPHYGRRGKGKRLKAGMVFTIEPMLNLGDYGVKVLDDDWTAVTIDGALSAQFEHTLLVTKTGVEVLTARDDVLVNSEDKPWSEPGELSAPAAYRADGGAAAEV
jgi:methionyl aminopeptidase